MTEIDQDSGFHLAHRRAAMWRRLDASARVSRGVIGDGKRDDRGKKGDDDRDCEPADDDIEIGGSKKLCVSLERRLVDDGAEKLVDREETLRQQRKQSSEIYDSEPQQRRREQEHSSSPRRETSASETRRDTLSRGEAPARASVMAAPSDAVTLWKRRLPRRRPVQAADRPRPEPRRPDGPPQA
jgi:hypothetical protein